MYNLLDSWFKMSVGDGAFYAVFGLMFVVLGITLLVGILTGVGAIMKRVNGRNAKKIEEKRAPMPSPLPEAPVEEGITPETVAAITAALMAFYEQENVKCDFVVRRIKRV